MRSSGLPEEVCYTLLYPDPEEHTVDIVKQYLRTSEQKAWLDAHDLSIEDLLNGRYGGDDEPGVERSMAHGTLSSAGRCSEPRDVATTFGTERRI